MQVLAIDTASQTASVALLEGEALLAETFVSAGAHHSRVLLSAVVDLLALTERQIGDTDLFVCTQGPGSFTGLRISAGTAKGFALAAGKPLVGVSTLETLAFGSPPGPRHICPMLDARRSQVYTALYHVRPDGTMEPVAPEQLADAADFARSIREETLFTGDGAWAYRDAIRTALGEKALMAPPWQGQVRAAAAGILGLRMFQAGRPSDPLAFAPRYLRQPEAEVKRARNQGGGD